MEQKPKPIRWVSGRTQRSWKASRLAVGSCAAVGATLGLDLVVSFMS